MRDSRRGKDEGEIIAPTSTSSGLVRLFPRRRARMRGSRIEIRCVYECGRQMMRSMPMQFWPEDWKTPRMRTEAIFRSSGSVMSSRIRAGSLPPSSTQTGVRDFAADAQTE